MEIIDGKAIASSFCQNIHKALEDMYKIGIDRADLAIIMIGNNPASEVYVRNKINKAKNYGILAKEYRFPENVSEEVVLELIDELNNTNQLDGILLQLPLPKHLNAQKLLRRIDPSKDVDGLHPKNSGLLMATVTIPPLVSCTPLGCLLLIQSVLPNLEGKRALVVGRSSLVGKPMGMLLLSQNATVTIAHSKTENLKQLFGESDIIVIAIGAAGAIPVKWAKDGAILIDVGINAVKNEDASSTLMGDFNTKDADKKEGFLTPVPGGVGPMTIACLLYNTYVATCLRNNVTPQSAESLCKGESDATNAL